MTKRAKVLSVTFKKALNFGNVYLVKFDNGDEGEYIDKANPQTYFVEGKESDYELVTKANGYTDVKKPASAGGGGGARPSRPTDNPDTFWRDKALIVSQSSMKAAIELIVSGKIQVNGHVTVEQLQVVADKIMQATIDLTNKYTETLRKTEL